MQGILFCGDGGNRTPVQWITAHASTVLSLLYFLKPNPYETNQIGFSSSFEF